MRRGSPSSPPFHMLSASYTHTHTHTHTSLFSLSLSHSLTHSLSRSHSLGFHCIHGSGLRTFLCDSPLESDTVEDTFRTMHTHTHTHTHIYLHTYTCSLAQTGREADITILNHCLRVHIHTHHTHAHTTSTYYIHVDR